ncbi:DNA ligase [Undibacterium cyanobacteriorum]|uniref:DNA ligase n=1 Tax=Undibacterium cyanobacteriorum TaxID=3073561 RepID=A0ABY9RMI5_9BURK|nr:DNA ligase [Undibacterium sp. 20NA77.5]WMW82415.1 DNA ligase [Undibacterium sp. 20NA77.5]
MNQPRRYVLRRFVQGLGHTSVGLISLFHLNVISEALASEVSHDKRRVQKQARKLESTALPLVLPETLSSLDRLKGKPSDYYVSEKLDGVRAYWNGKQLLFRSGRVIPAPSWFVQDFPVDIELDGELWMARGKFEELSAAVRRSQLDHDEWRQIKFCLFELPHGKGEFSNRYLELQSLVKRLRVPWLHIVDQVEFATLAAINNHFHDLTKAGAEGVVLHAKQASFIGARNAAMFKYKPFFDAEAQVVRHLEGSGKYQGKLGAYLVENRDGLRFKIGSGFSDEMRDKPLPVGTWLTYRYRELNPSGVPRFATYLREYDAD